MTTTSEDQSRQSEYGNAEAGGNGSAGGSPGGGKTGTTTTRSSSPKPSPSSWDNAQIHRGRSRARGTGTNRDEPNGLRRFVCPTICNLLGLELKGLMLRGYHALHSSFGKVFNVENRWKIIREMGSGAYGFVVFVRSFSLLGTV